MEKLVLVGGGGHAKVLLDLIITAKVFSVVGILDEKVAKGNEVGGVKILGDDSLLPLLLEDGVFNACIGVGSTGNTRVRKRIYKKVKEIGFKTPPMIHPKTVVSRMSKIGEGVQVMAGAVIQTGTIIGENSIINTSASIDHDCMIGNHVHVCPGVVLSGGVSLGSRAFVGAGSTVIQNVRIGKDAIVGAGSVVITNIADRLKVKGVPAKE